MKNGKEKVVAMTFKVQKEELPDAMFGGKKRYEWPFGTMKVGECFYFPLKNGDGVRQVYTVRGKIMQAAREWRASGMRFATRHLRDRQAIGVWRVK